MDKWVPLQVIFASLKFVVETSRNIQAHRHTITPSVLWQIKNENILYYYKDNFICYLNVVYIMMLHTICFIRDHNSMLNSKSRCQHLIPNNNLFLRGSSLNIDMLCHLTSILRICSDFLAHQRWLVLDKIILMLGVQEFLYNHEYDSLDILYYYYYSLFIQNLIEYILIGLPSKD